MLRRGLERFANTQRGSSAGGSNFVGSGLVLWLDGTDTSTMTRVGNRVDEWRDKQGSGNKVATGFAGSGFNPNYVSTLNGGQGGVRFLRGSSNFLETAAAFTTMNWATGWTMLYVGQFTDQVTCFAASDTNRVIFGRNMQNRLGGGNQWNSVPGTSINTNVVAGTVYSGSVMKPIINGTATSILNGSPSVGTGDFGKLQVGGWLPNSPSASLDAAAFLFYNRALTDAEILKMTLWLRDHYGYGAIPSQNFNFVVDGNSLACGSLSTGTTWAMGSGIEEANGSPKGIDFSVVARNGLETPTMASLAPTVVDPLLNTSVAASRRIVLAWEITNQLAAGSSAAVAYAAIKSYCQARKTAGWKVIVVTCLPRSNAGLRAGFEADRTSVNASILANAISEGWADAIADVGGDATIGVAGASDNTTYYNADKVHLNTTGHGVAKTYITAAINTVTGL